MREEILSEELNDRWKEASSHWQDEIGDQFYSTIMQKLIDNAKSHETLAMQLNRLIADILNSLKLLKEQAEQYTSENG